MTSTRTGGVSRGPYASLNLGAHVADSWECVRENRRRFCEALALPPGRLVIGAQCHSATVRWVSSKNGGQGWLTPEEALPATDGLIAHEEEGLYLGVLTADCLPVLLYDPVRRVYGAIHAGRRGLIQGVLEAALEVFVRFGSNPSDLVAVLGAGIHRERYEVDPASARQFQGRFGGETVSGRRVDLYAAARRVLIAGGVPPGRIGISSLDPAERTDLFYSHRAEGGRTGRMLSLIGPSISIL
ncbi:MAG: laccase domain protein [Candidatus Poribacteria bacterium]|nr:MAG: laccase domain protein [Candidatus Poribacteria bacterium]